MKINPVAQNCFFNGASCTFKSERSSENSAMQKRENIKRANKFAWGFCLSGLVLGCLYFIIQKCKPLSK